MTGDKKVILTKILTNTWIVSSVECSKSGAERIVKNSPSRDGEDVPAMTDGSMRRNKCLNMLPRVLCHKRDRRPGCPTLLFPCFVNQESAATMTMKCEFEECV